jgi:prepilin-type processing-associated H-X9-DG protein
VVIAIIAILASMLLPSLTKAKDQARRISCTSNLKQIAASTTMYVDSNDDIIPFLYNPGNAALYMDFGIKGRWYVLLARDGYIPGNELDPYQIDTQAASVINCPSESFRPPADSLAGAWGYAHYFAPSPIAAAHGVADGEVDFMRLGRVVKPVRKVWLADTRPNYSWLNSYTTEVNDPYYGIGVAHSVAQLWLRHRSGANHLFLDGHVAHLNVTTIAGDLEIYRNYER